MNPPARKKLAKLSVQLDAAKNASEATTKEVQQARRTSEHLKRDIDRRPSSHRAKRERKVSKDRYTKDGRSKAAVELGRRGGAATAKTRTRRQRSALATRAARSRWNTR